MRAAADCARSIPAQHMESGRARALHSLRHSPRRAFRCPPWSLGIPTTAAPHGRESVANSEETTMDVRPSSIAGTWYPNDPAILIRDIERYLAHVPVPSLPGSIY